MKNISQIISNPDVLVGLAPEEVAKAILEAAKTQLHNGMFQYDRIVSAVSGPRADEVRQALREAWQWLILNFLIMPAEGPNGISGGWMVFTRRGAAIANGQSDFESFREAAAFPKTLIHPTIADKVWLALARGDLDDAVFASFKAVEESVRKLGGYADTDIGVDLMRKAFNNRAGPLTNFLQPEAEREALEPGRPESGGARSVHPSAPSRCRSRDAGHWARQECGGPRGWRRAFQHQPAAGLPRLVAVVLSPTGATMAAI
jgi:Protein of unknown function (Hypoth_ymh)